jgi:hypothetical protein
VTTIDEILRAAEREVLAAEYGGLRLGVRLRLWNALERHYGREGRLRRAALSLRVVHDVAVPVWDGAGFEGELAEAVPRLAFVARLVALSLKEADLNRHAPSIFSELADVGGSPARRGFFGSKTPKFRNEGELLRAVADRTGRIGETLFGHIRRAWPDLAEGRLNQFGCALTAATLACTDGFGTYLDLDEGDYELDDEDVDFDSWGPHYFAARATTDREETPEGIEAMRTFWLRWVRDLVPSILTPRLDLYTFP